MVVAVSQSQRNDARERAHFLGDTKVVVKGEKQITELEELSDQLVEYHSLENANKLPNDCTHMNILIQTVAETEGSTNKTCQCILGTLMVIEMS